MRHHINRTTLKFHRNGIGIGTDLEGNVFDVGFVSPVIIILRKNHIFKRRPGNILIWSRSDGICRRIGVMLGDDGCGYGGNVCQEIVIHMFKGYGDVLLINDIHAYNIRKRRYPRLFSFDISAFTHGILYILCSNVCTVVEFHLITNGECVGQAVFADFNFTCYRRNDITIGIGFYQTFENIEEYFLGSCRHHIVGVKSFFNILRDTNGDRVFWISFLVTCASAQCNSK